MPRLFFAVHEQQHSIVHEQQHSIVHQQVKNPLHQRNRWWSGFFTCSATTFFTPQWTVVHERVFLGPPWTKSFAKSLFLLVHEQLYGIVRQHAFIPRCWTPPNSRTDYLGNPCSCGWPRLHLPQFFKLSENDPCRDIPYYVRENHTPWKWKDHAVLLIEEMMCLSVWLHWKIPLWLDLPFADDTSLI